MAAGSIDQPLAGAPDPQVDQIGAGADPALGRSQNLKGLAAVGEHEDRADPVVAAVEGGRAADLNRSLTGFVTSGLERAISTNHNPPGEPCGLSESGAASGLEGEADRSGEQGPTQRLEPPCPC